MKFAPGTLTRLACVALSLSLGVLAGAAPVITARTNAPSGVYSRGDEIRFEVTASEPVAEPVPYRVLRDNAVELRAGDLDLSDGRASVSVRAEQPGSVQLRFLTPVKDPALRNAVAAGAAVEPAKIRPAAPPPDDFDAFWKEKLAELAAVPMNARLEPKDVGEPEIEYYRVKLAGHRDSTVHGQLAKPAGRAGEKFPAVLVLQYAGVYPLKTATVTNRAKQGWLVLNISAHDAEFDMTAEEAKALAARLGSYASIGQTDRETSYFLRMLLACHRAADYLASRDDWDGRTLIANGASQGGMQAIAIAALHDKISHVITDVPAGSDTLAKTANRAISWPSWQARAKGADAEKIMTTSRYFDTANFARRVTAPTLVGVALLDTVCPPTSLFAMCNQLAGPKEIVVLPEADHHRTPPPSRAKLNERVAAWFSAAQAGRPVPVAHD